MNVIVTHENFSAALSTIASHEYLALDTETTGLNPYKGDYLFSIIISTEEDNFYFNFNSFPDHLLVHPPSDTKLTSRHKAAIEEVINVEGKTIFMHNALFDLGMLYQSQIELTEPNIFCTMSLARLVNNLLPSYSLEYLGNLIGYPKDDTVEKYISKHKLYTLEDVGKKKPNKNKHYNLVPFEIISAYGMRDGEVTYKLGRYIMQRLAEMNIEQKTLGLPSLEELYHNEMKLTKVLFNMNKIGVKIDRALCEEAYNYEMDQVAEACNKFESLTGIEFEDSRKVLVQAFEAAGLDHGYTDKGNPSFKDDLLPDNTLGNLIKQYRSSYKKATTYYKNFLDLADDNDNIHCSFFQSGTLTGRMSCRNPNLQNVPKRKEDDAKYKVRSAFVPREGYTFFMIDFDQMEYRLLLDLADEERVIDSILKEGLDVHTATANEMNVDRFSAKTLNFMLLYGGGAQKLADALGISKAEAKNKKARYFSTLNRVKYIVQKLISTVEGRGWITNLMGRRLILPTGKSYQIPNHYIQGGCGDIVKVAMIRIDKLLRPFKSRMVLQIHDELLLEIHDDEHHLINNIKVIMENAYNYKKLPLTVGVDYSTKNWHEKEKYEA